MPAVWWELQVTMRTTLATPVFFLLGCCLMGSSPSSAAEDGVRGDRRIYRQTVDVRVEETGEPTISRAPGDLFEVILDVDVKARTVLRRSVRRLDATEPDTAFPRTYAIVGRASLRRDDGESEDVLIAVSKGILGEAKTEVLWLGATTALSSENSGMFLLWHTARYQRIR